MRGALIIKYVPDCLIIGVLASLAATIGIVDHGATKPYTAYVATIAPVTFALAVFALFAAAAAGRRLARGALVKRLLIDLAVASVFVPTAFLKVESLFAPAELAQHTDVATVVARVATNEDRDRLKAWGRILTMSKDEQEQVAAALAPLLVSANAGTRTSAELTLDVALRRHSVATLVAMAPALKIYFARRAAAGPSSPGSLTLDDEPARAAAFTHRFVAENAASIRRAFETDNRQKLPAGGIEALMLALAADDGIGRALLTAYATGAGDADLQPLAQAVLAATGVAH